MSETKTRAARCPAGYVSRSIRTDPEVHEVIKNLAETQGKQGGAGQIYLELAIKYIKTETGQSFSDGFKAFYAAQNTKD